jgi:hypothetical protein
MTKTILVVMIAMTLAGNGFAGEYRGRYCEGKGDVQYLQLLDQSFGFFHPNWDTPNISMLYFPDWDCLIEGFPTWQAWWIQNSYGPTYCSLPFLQEPWITFLQHSQDMWFNNQGDGKKGGYGPFAELVGPEGCLCDCAIPDAAIYRQGDCKWPIHDWGFEFTAAGVVMQAEMLLIRHDKDAARKYLPNLERACDFIETRRDANLLAPSYGGVRQADGSFGKGYLAGLSVTYLAATDRMIELQKLVGDSEKVKLYRHRREITRRSLKRLVTPDGYFVKFIEPDGTKHGVFGQAKYGYFEAAPNVDAICFRAVDPAQAERIYAKIASIPQLRKYDYLITNYPSLDDTYENWGSTELGGLWEFGRWVNGGVWSTMEARAIMAYYRLGKYEDIWRVNVRSMKLAADYQMDAPLTDFGNEVWFKDRLTNLCYDALGIPAATIRGLFEYVYTADSLILYPHIPPCITEYTQRWPIRFGEKKIIITVINGGPSVKSVTVNDEKIPVSGIMGERQDGRVVLPYKKLPQNAWVVIETAGEMNAGEPIFAKAAAKREDVSVGEAAPMPEVKPAELPAEMKAAYDKAVAMQIKLCTEPGHVFERAYLDEIIRAFDAYKMRASRDASGWYSDLTPEKRAAILKMYADAAMNLARGFQAYTDSHR